MPVRGIDSTQSSHDSCSHGADSPAVAEQEARRARLVRVIETELVPRLMLSALHRTQNPSPSAPAQAPVSAVVADFAGLLTRGDRLLGVAFVQALRQDGMPLGRIYVELIGPTARYLYEGWQHGDSSLRHVLAGLIQLIGIMRAVSAKEPAQRRWPRDRAGGWW
jgi:hypothetical protein